MLAARNTVLTQVSLDNVPHLLIQIDAVQHNDDCVKLHAMCILDMQQLMCQSCNRQGLYGPVLCWRRNRAGRPDASLVWIAVTTFFTAATERMARLASSHESLQ